MLLLVPLGCSATKVELPGKTDLYMEMSIAGKPAFITHTEWDGETLQNRMDGRFIIGNRQTGLSTSMTATVSADGRPTTFKYENQQPGALTRLEGKLMGDKLAITVTAADGSQSQRELECPSGTLLMDMTDMMAGKRLAHGEDTVKYKVIDLEQIKTAEITYKVSKRDGEGFNVHSERSDMSLLALDIRYNLSGEIMTADNTSLRLSMRRITAEEANKPNKELLNIDSLTYVEYTGEMKTKASLSVIRLTLGESKLGTSVAKDAPGQTYEQNQDGSVAVTIKAESAPSGKGTEKIPDEAKAYLNSTTMVQWKDPLLTTAAQDYAPEGSSPWTLTRLAVNWVGAKLAKDRPERGMLTAREALVRGCGDCTEHSVLLAAMLRARGVPCRLATGIVYAYGRFGFHMWDLAWVEGRWVSVDAMFGYAPSPADRICMALVGPDDKVEEVASALLPALGQLQITVEKSE